MRLNPWPQIKHPDSAVLCLILVQGIIEEYSGINYDRSVMLHFTSIHTTLVRKRENMGSTAPEPPPTYVLEDLVKTNVLIPIDPKILTFILSNPPFVSVPGGLNIRDLGGLTGSLTDSPTVRKGFYFRSGMLSFLKDEGIASLASRLGGGTIFDLRLAEERESLPSPAINGVKTCWLEVAERPQPPDLVLFAAADGGIDAMLKMYKNILVTHVPIYKAVFSHIRDYCDRPVLFHCVGSATSLLHHLPQKIPGQSSHILLRCAHMYLLDMPGSGS